LWVASLVVQNKQLQVYIIIFWALQEYNCVCSVRLHSILYVLKFTLLVFISNFAEISYTAKTVRQAWSSRCNYQPTISQLLVIHCCTDTEEHCLKTPYWG